MRYVMNAKLGLWLLSSILTILGSVSMVSAQEVASGTAEPPRLSDWKNETDASNTAEDLLRSRVITPTEPLPSDVTFSTTTEASRLDSADVEEFRFSTTESSSNSAQPVLSPNPATSLFDETTGGRALFPVGETAAPANRPRDITGSSTANGAGTNGASNSDLFAAPFNNSVPGSSSPWDSEIDAITGERFRRPDAVPSETTAYEGLFDLPNNPALPAPAVPDADAAGLRIDVFPVGLGRAIANGRSLVELEGSILGVDGSPLLEPVTVTLTATAGEFAGADQEPDRPGFQVIAREGRFVAALQSSLDAQQVRVRAAIARDDLREALDLEEDEFSELFENEYATSTGLLPEIEAFTQVEFVTELRPTLLAGTVNLRIGEAGTDYWSSFREFLNPDELNDGVAFDLSSAVFGIGSIGEWQFLAAYNSERTLNETCDGGDRLFRDTQFCEQNYPVYGDSSTVDTLTPSQDSLFVRFQRDSLTPGAEPDFFMWGDYGTSELSRASQLFTATSRNLHGFKANYSLGNLQLTALYADNVDGFQRDTIPPDGTSGYYFVSRRLVIPGSEQVFVETEELNRPGTVVDREQLQRGPDYEIDYDRGAIMFRQPIQATEFDIFGNSLVRRIVVTYQYEGGGGGDSNLIAGRLQYNLAYGFERPSWIGVSYLTEDQGEQDFELFGFDFLLPIGDVALIEGEYARSDHTSLTFGDVSGNAYRLEASANFNDAIALRAYYRTVDETFANDSTFSFTPGQTRIGGALSAAVTTTTRVNLQYDFEENFGVAPLVITDLDTLLNPGLQPIPGSSVDNTLSTFRVGVQQEIGRAIFNLSYVDRDRTDRTAPDSSLDTNSSQLVSQLTVPLAERLTFQALNAIGLSDGEDPLYPDRTALGLNWAAFPGVNLRLTQQFLYGSSFEDRSITSLDTVIEQELDENTSLRNRYSIIGGINGISAQSALGLNHAWVISPGLRLNLGYERISGDIFADTAVGQQYAQPYTVAQSSGVLGLQEANSYSIGLDYTDDPNFKASARFEHRDSEAGDNTVWYAAAAGRLTPELTVLARYQQSNFSNQLLTGLLSDTSTLRLGLAYRDPDNDSFNGLLRYDYRRNPGTTPDSILADSGRGSEDHTFGIEGIYAPTWRWEFYGKYALRYSNAFVADDLTVSNAIHLAQGRVAYRLGYRWDVAGDVRWIGQTNSGFNETGLALELGYYVTPDLRLGVGYSFGAVDDDGFEGYRSDGGPYLAVNLKVNELLQRFGAPDISPEQLQETVIEASAGDADTDAANATAADEPVSVRQSAASSSTDSVALTAESGLNSESELKQALKIGRGEE